MRSVTSLWLEGATLANNLQSRPFLSSFPTLPAAPLPNALNAPVSLTFPHGALLLFLCFKECLLDFTANADQPFFRMSGAGAMGGSW
jgi:hypothetical protein